MKTVFIPPIVDWTFLRQLPQQIASQFAKNGYKVIYCNTSLGAYKVDEVEPNLFVYKNWSQAMEEIEKKRIKIDIFYNTWAKNEKFIDMIKPKFSIYHSCDVFEEWKPFENKIIEKSDVVLCTSQYIYDIRSKQHNNVHLVRNACTSEFIEHVPKMPEDMKFIKEPIFLFAGAVGAWVSTYLIKKVAENYATALVGREYGKTLPSNAINLGVKSHDCLADYYYASDFGLLPFNTKSEITQAANPIKVWEYLSCGLPVLATAWQETELEELKDVVFTAKTDEEFVELSHMLANLTCAQKLDLSIKAKTIAQNNTWEKRFEQIKNIIT